MHRLINKELRSSLGYNLQQFGYWCIFWTHRGIDDNIPSICIQYIIRRWILQTYVGCSTRNHPYLLKFKILLLFFPYIETNHRQSLYWYIVIWFSFIFYLVSTHIPISSHFFLLIFSTYPLPLSLYCC